MIASGVTAQLIDALDGRPLWAGRYDRPAGNIFALQDEITHEVLVELQVKLTLGENARISSEETKSMEACCSAIRAVPKG